MRNDEEFLFFSFALGSVLPRGKKHLVKVKHRFHKSQKFQREQEGVEILKTEFLAFCGLSDSLHAPTLFQQHPVQISAVPSTSSMTILL